MPRKMKFRKHFLPKSPQDIGAFVLVVAMIPITYWFELSVVLPTSYPEWSTWYIIHFVCGTFVLLNVTSNFVAIITTDTSIAGEMLPSTEELGWGFCQSCESMTPPRSWHCNTCNTCILKRDHHCIFTGCCIGHFNQRYFIMFLTYMFLGTLYSTYFNNYFIWHNVDFTATTLVKIIFPLAMLVFGLDGSLGQYYLMIYLLNFIGMVFTFALLWIQLDLVQKGIVQYEKKHLVADYNFGLKRNVEVVFGKRWYVAWLCPFIVSELPNDGISWKTNSSSIETMKQK